MATKKFNRVAATDEQINAAKQSSFFFSYVFPNDLELEIAGYSFVAFESEGKKSQRATPVILLKDKEEVIFINSLKKERFDYDGNPVSTIGTLNKFVKELPQNITLGEAITKMEEKYPIGTKLQVHLRRYFGRDRNGDGREIQFNEYSVK